MTKTADDATNPLQTPLNHPPVNLLPLNHSTLGRPPLDQPPLDANLQACCLLPTDGRKLHVLHPLGFGPPLAIAPAVSLLTGGG